MPLATADLAWQVNARHRLTLLLADGRQRATGEEGAVATSPTSERHGALLGLLEEALLADDLVLATRAGWRWQSLREDGPLTGATAANGPQLGADLVWFTRALGEHELR